MSYSNRHADLLFELISRRYEQKSTVITTNRAFKEWHEVFPNAACVVSLIDRLVHRCEIVAIEGESYRLKEAKVMGQRSQEEGNSCTMWELPTHWTAAQALAVFEVLDDLRDLVVAGYAKKIQQAARLDRTVTTPSLPANIDNGDVPF